MPKRDTTASTGRGTRRRAPAPVADRATTADLSTHRSAESELRHREFLLNATQRLSKTGGWEWVVASQAMTWTDETYRIHGLVPGELAPGSPQHIEKSSACYPPAARDSVLAAFRRCVERGEPYDLELPFVSATGRSMWVRTAAMAIRENGRVVRVIGHIMDITEQKWIEQARVFLLQCGLPGSGQDFFAALARYLAEMLNMEYVCIDRLAGDGSTAQPVAVYNAGALESHASRDLKETPWGKVVGKTFCHYPRGVQQQFPRDAALQNLAAESYVGTTLWDSQGRPLGLISIISRRPLTEPRRAEALLNLVASRAAGELERRNAEIALRESEERFTNAFEYAAIGMALVSPNGHWLKVNQATCLFLGYASAELMAMTFQEITHPDDLDTDLALVRQMLAGEIRTYQMEKRYFHKQGHTVWALLSVSLVRDPHQKPLYFISQIENITERKQSEAALRQSELLLNASQRLSLTGGWEWDVTAQALTWTEETYRIHDLPIPEHRTAGGDLVAASIACYPPPGGDAVQAAFRRCLEQGEPYDLEVPFISTKGRALWVRTAGTAVREGGRVVRVMGHIMDITARRQVEEQLRRSEARFRSYFELPLAGIAITSPQKGWLEVNPRLCALLGYTREELQTKTWAELTHPDDLAADATQFSRALAGHIDAYEVEKRFLRKDGQALWTRLAARGVRRADGSVDYFIALIQDITVQKEQEEALRLQALVLDQIQDQVTITDLNGVITYVNRAQEKVLGRPQAAFVGQKTDIYGEDGTRGATQAQIVEITVREGSWRGEVVNYAANGSESIMDCRTQVVQDSQGKAVALCGIATNITGRKRTEREREALLASLTRTNAELQSLMHTASHDLRQPLVNLLGFSERLAKLHALLREKLQHTDLPPTVRTDVDALLQERIPHALSFVAKSGNRLGQLINGLLRLSRIDHGAIHSVCIDMNALLHSLLATSALQIEQAQAEVCIEPLLPCTGDTIQVSQVFANLLDNALKYRDPARPLRLEIGSHLREGVVDYTVRDTARGIPAERHEEVWGLFRRLDPEGAVPGDGLGLAVSKRIVEHHGGRMWLESQPGRGSTFHVELPAARTTSN